MRAYTALFEMRLMKGLQYRVSALAGVATQFFWGFIYIMIYAAFYKSTSNPQPISFTQLVQVLWLQQSFLVLIVLWSRDNELMGMITTGKIAYELTRPLDLYRYWYTKLVATRLSGVLLRFIPIITVAFLLPHPYNLTLPNSLLSFVLFLISLILALILVVAISMFIYISTFYTLEPMGSFIIFGVIGEFLSGLLIPVPLMPEPLKTIVYILPFRYTSDLPFRIYAGNIGTKEALFSIGVQLLWIFISLSLGKVWMNKALKRVVVQGG